MAVGKKEKSALMLVDSDESADSVDNWHARLLLTYRMIIIILLFSICLFGFKPRQLYIKETLHCQKAT